MIDWHPDRSYAGSPDPGRIGKDFLQERESKGSVQSQVKKNATL